MAALRRLDDTMEWNRWLTVGGYLSEQGVTLTPKIAKALYDTLTAWGQDNGLEPFVGEASRTMNAYPEIILSQALSQVGAPDGD